jgi:hypothetical protein
MSRTLDEIRDRLQQMETDSPLLLHNCLIDMTRELATTQADQNKIIDALLRILSLIQEIEENGIPENHYGLPVHQTERNEISTLLRDIRDR